MNAGCNPCVITDSPLRSEHSIPYHHYLSIYPAYYHYNSHAVEVIYTYMYVPTVEDVRIVYPCSR